MRRKATARQSGRQRGRGAPLRFLTDHNVRAEVADLLEGSGFHTRRSYHVGLGQLDDPEVAAYSAAEDLIVVTHDGAFYSRLVRSSQRAVLLRVTESHARRRLKETLPAVIGALRTGQNAVRLLKNAVVVDSLP